MGVIDSSGTNTNLYIGVRSDSNTNMRHIGVSWCQDIGVRTHHIGVRRLVSEDITLVSVRWPLEFNG